MTVPAGGTSAAVSIVVSTRNRASALDEALRTYHHMRTAVPWELIVVDNGSTDDTPGVLRRFIADAGFPCRTVLEPRPGLSRARNTGWRASAGDVVTFTDDDCYPDPSLVEEIWRTFGDTRIGYAGGRVILHDPEDFPITIQLRDTPLDLVPGAFVEAGVIHGANMAARRRILEDTGGFDDLLGSGTAFGCEDVEFLSRASALGAVGRYDPRIVVRHHHRRRAPEDVARLAVGYDIGRGAYYMSCLLDRARRGAAAHYWYWKIRGRLAGREPRTESTWREITGALGYAWNRVRHPGVRPSRAHQTS